MSEKSLDNTVGLAKKLIDRLPEEMNIELKMLLDKAEKGDDISIEIIDLLSPHENIRRWLREQISPQSGTKGMTRGFSPVPGRQSSVSTSKQWTCPEDDCDESLPIIQEGEDAPSCDIHNAKMSLDQ